MLAAELLYHVLRHPAAMHETKARAQRLLTDVAAALPPEALAAAQARAERQTLAVTVAAVLGDLAERIDP